MKKTQRPDFGDVEGLIPNPFKGIVETEEQERVKKALERAIDWSWVEKIENLRSITPEGVDLGKVDLFEEEWIFKGYHNPEKKLFKREKMRLLILILAHTGLSFVELGKADVLSITRTMNGSKVLSGQRVKTKQVYTIPVTPKLEGLINKLGPLPWQPFVDENLIVDYKKKETTYHVLYKYLKEVLMDQIGWDEDYDLTPHRLRHTFAMRQLNHFGFSLMVVARMLGDDEKIVRNTYANHDDDAISKAFNAEMARFIKKQKEKGEEGEDLEGVEAI
jgi:integrase